MPRSTPDLPSLAASEVAGFWTAGDVAEGMLRLLTLQDREAYARLVAGEQVTGSVRHVLDEDVPAYAWMTVQLERLGWQVDGAPVWAWQRVRFEELSQTWPDGAAADIVVVVLDVPRERAVLSAFAPWQELVDEDSAGGPSPDWDRCLDLDAHPHSAIQATMPFIDPGDVVRACRLHL